MPIQNPIIRGFCPDPSVCRAGGKYYLACSSFQYLPGVPIFESDDLINWRLVANALTRREQVQLHQVPSSGGVFAPTLRCHDGVFYMVTNNNTFGKNFYITARNIRGPWSGPIFVDQEGIDPSLLFDNGHVYFTSNGTDENGKGCILQCEIDVATGRKLTDSVPVWGGSGGRYLESPHLYHIGNWYYLMVAEGGTEYGHMVTYARSHSPFGPFEGYAHNPVLTNRNLGGHESTIQGIGHGDLIDDGAGNWYMVTLGFRQIGMWQPFHHLGREVFLARVYWQEDGWFTAGENGQVHETLEIAGEIPQILPESAADFTEHTNPLRWLHLRDYVPEHYAFGDKSLTLTGTEIDLNQRDTPTFIGLRQAEFDTALTVTVGGEAAEAGVTCYMDEDHHYDLALTNENGRKQVLCSIRIGDAQQIHGRWTLPEGQDAVTLKIRSTAETYDFYCQTPEGERHLGRARSKYLSSEVAGGFTGVVVGFYAVDKDGKAARFRDFRWMQGAAQ